jgi:putative ABC transport system permease protein
MSFWVRWSLRDLRQRWLLVAAIALVIAIGTGLAAGLGSMESWRVKSNDASFAALGFHDLRASLTEGSYLREGELVRAVESIRDAGLVTAAEERLTLPTQLDASASGQTVLTPGQIVGVDLSGGGPHVDGLAAYEGRNLTEADRGKPLALLEFTYADHYGLPPTGSVAVAGGSRLDYVGVGTSPEDFIVVPPSGALLSVANYGVLFTSLETAQELAGRPGAVNEVVVALAPGTDVTAVEAQLEHAFEERLPGVGVTLTEGVDEPAHRILYEDASNDQQLWNVFAFLVLAGAGLAAFNLIGRVVEAQRREIGIGMALGVAPRRLAFRPLAFGSEIALLGVFFGIGIGFAINAAIRSLLTELLPLPVLETPFQPSVFVRGAALGFAIPFLATAYPVWRGVRMKPIDAIRIGFRATGSSGLAPMLKQLPLPGRTTAQIPLRNTLRAPRRTLMTVLGLAAVVTVVVALFGMLDSFDATLARIERETLRGSPDRMTVELEGFLPAEQVEATLAEEPVIGAAEPLIRVPGTLVAGREEVDVALELIDPEGALWRPDVSAGSFQPGSDGILIAEKAAADLGVEPGDVITVRHPRRTGPDAFDEVETTVRVAGLHPNPFRLFAYMDESQARLLGLAETANTVWVTPAPDVTGDEVIRTLFGQPGVTSVQAVAATTDAVQDAIDDYTGILRVTALAMTALALLLAFNSTSINAEERSREHATMFAFGLPVRTVVRMSVVESIVVGLAATLVGIGLGLAVLSYVFRVFLPEVLPELGAVVTLSAGSCMTAVLVGVVATALAPLLTVRRLLRMDVPSTLRVVE